MRKIESTEFMIIAGPCAAESRTQVLDSALMAKQRGIRYVRASLWKPRTKPGTFSGVGEQGIEWLAEIAQMGLVPATEVMEESHAESVVNAISGRQNANVIIWLGSRNQNQQIQEKVGRVVKGDSNTKLLIKNQPWADKAHWMGIIDWVLQGGADPRQLILCHRGFWPGTDGMRNTPDFKMAMEVKKESGLPMIIDSSHIGGTTDKVLEIARKIGDTELGGKSFDGLMIEVHPDPIQAMTDKSQQLSWRELDSLFDKVGV